MLDVNYYGCHWFCKSYNYSSGDSKKYDNCNGQFGHLDKLGLKQVNFNAWIELHVTLN